MHTTNVVKSDKKIQAKFIKWEAKLHKMEKDNKMHNKSNTFQKELETLTNTRWERNTNLEYDEKIGEKNTFCHF